MYTVRRYTPEDKKIWDTFVKEARNATFLFMRDYMDYHSDRFHDCSWMVFKGSRLVALLPANLTSDNVLHSHQGLTYGGWILPMGHINASDVLEIFEEAIKVCKAEGIVALDYKPLPYIYASAPSDDAEYALFRLGAVLTEAGVSSAIDYSSDPDPRTHYNKLRRRTLSSTAEEEWIIRETDCADEIMNLVSSCLQERHDVLPVHTASEMQLLKNRFPDNIHFWILYLDDAKPQAAVCIYDTGLVAHAQYIATSPEGRDRNLLTPLFDYLISDVYRSRKYFDFGISTENHGQILNHGLLRQKSSFGASGVLYRRFTLCLKSPDISN